MCLAIPRRGMFLRTLRSNGIAAMASMKRERNGWEFLHAMAINPVDQCS
jgi:hypothetical protein